MNARSFTKPGVTRCPLNASSHCEFIELLSSSTLKMSSTDTLACHHHEPGRYIAMFLHGWNACPLTQLVHSASFYLGLGLICVIFRLAALMPNRALGATHAFGEYLEKTFQHLYGPQTTSLEGRTNVSERIFKALFTYVSTQFGRMTLEKCF